MIGYLVPVRFLGLFVVLLSGCGAKSALSIDRPDAGPDADLRVCLGDRECDDGIECTSDACTRGRCVNEPRSELCVDAVFCNGVERCEVGRGCVSEPIDCSDGIDCTMDGCNEDEGACVHEGDNSLCPISHRCDLDRACVARALVHDSGALFDVDVPSGDVHFIASTDVSLTDLALHPDGRLFGIDGFSLFSVDESNGRARWIADTSERMVALEVGPDRMLYGAGDSTIVRIDPTRGTSERLGAFPASWQASGDIAFVDGRLLVTGTNAPFDRSVSDVLFEVPLDGAAPTMIGAVGFACIWALAPIGETLYGLTCNEQLLEIDAQSAAGRVIRAGLGIEVSGAAAR